jgi:hypothetical protein
MTYRIDDVRQSKIPGYSWCFEIKGFEGRGEYATLYADQDGRKLHKFESISIELIPGTEAFEVPKDATKAEAHHALAMFLYRLGWGPMVDQAGNVVDPSKADPDEPMRL